MNELKYGLLIGILSNHGISAQKAWLLPSVLKDRLNVKYKIGLDSLDTLSIDQVVELYIFPDKIHRFNNKMAVYVHDLIAVFNNQYNGDFDLLFPHDNAMIINNVSHLPGMSIKKAKHLIVYLCAIDDSYTITEHEYREYTKDCLQLVERFDENLQFLKLVCD